MTTFFADGTIVRADAIGNESPDQSDLRIYR